MANSHGGADVRWAGLLFFASWPAAVVGIALSRKPPPQPVPLWLGWTALVVGVSLVLVVLSIGLAAGPARP